MEKKKDNFVILPVWATVALASIGIGAIITAIVTCICGGYDETVRRFIIWFIASALFGLASLLIFGKDRFTLPVATLLHAVVCFIIVIAATCLCGFDGGLGGNIIIIAIVFVVVYAVIFTITYLSSKSEERKVNERLNRK